MRKSLLILSFAALTLMSCEKENVKPAHGEQATLDCKRPEYLKAGDTVALISPSYFTPMENVERTAALLQS